MVRIISVLLFSLSVLFSLNTANANCLKYCTPGKSKPCGMTCIPLELNCTKPTTRSCMGPRPQSAKTNYTNPKYVEAEKSSKRDKAD